MCIGLIPNNSEQALDAPVTAFWGLYRNDYVISRNIDVTRYVQLNHVKGYTRRLEKHRSIAEIRPILDILAEAKILADLIVAAKPLIVKGRKPSANAKPADLSNTGACSIYQNQQKLTGEKKMVHHGFRISDGLGHYFGMRSGKCFGCDYEAYGLSNAGNIAFKASLEEQKAGRKLYLKRLKTGEVKEFTDLERRRVNGHYQNVPVTVREGEPGFPRRVESEINSVKGDIRHLTRGIAGQQKNDYRLEIPAAAWREGTKIMIQKPGARCGFEALQCDGHLRTELKMAGQGWKFRPAANVPARFIQ